MASSKTKRGEAERITFICAECGAEKERYKSLAIDKDTKKLYEKMYCSRLCQRLNQTKYLTVEEKRARAREIQRAKYRNDREWAARRSALSGARIRAKKDADPTYTHRISVRTWESIKRRRAEDPVFAERYKTLRLKAQKRYRDRKRDKKLSTAS